MFDLSIGEADRTVAPRIGSGHAAAEYGVWTDCCNRGVGTSLAECRISDGGEKRDF